MRKFMLCATAALSIFSLTLAIGDLLFGYPLAALYRDLVMAVTNALIFFTWKAIL
jgi:hypothetical protein